MLRIGSTPVLPDITEWSTDSLLVQVTRERFFVQAQVIAAAEGLRDFAIGTLQILEHTRTIALGLNRSMHFNVGGEENWHSIGDRLAPKDLWLPHLPSRLGMRALQIEAARRMDEFPVKTLVSVHPSRKYEHCVYFDVNNEIKNVDASSGTRYFVKVITDHWSPLLDEARSMAEAVLEGALR